LSYHNIAEKGGWDPIVLSEKSNPQTRDTDVILQIRKRLFITGDLIMDSRQKFDNELLEGVLKYRNATDLPQTFTVTTTY
jgi:hypothetical protein